MERNYLTQQEVQSLINADLPDRQFETARDIFIFCCLPSENELLLELTVCQSFKEARPKSGFFNILPATHFAFPFLQQQREFRQR
jgi:hypothetical protein